MSNTYMSESLIYEVKNIAGSQGYRKCEREHSNAMLHEWEAQDNTGSEHGDMHRFGK